MGSTIESPTLAGSGIAVVFDLFGHPTQPWTLRFASSLKRELPGARLFARRIVGASLSELTVRPVVLGGRVARAMALARLAFQGSSGGRTAITALAKERGTPQQLAKWFPLLQSRARLVHLWNSQMFPQLRGVLAELEASVAVSFRGYDLLVRPKADPAWREELEGMFQYAVALHCVSNHLAAAARSLGAPDDKIVVIRRGVGEEFLQNRRELREGPPYGNESLQLLSVGRLTWEKGHIYALQAISRVRAAGVPCHLRIVGAGGERAHLAYWVDRLRLNEQVSFEGEQPRENVVEYMRSADLLLHPSLSEGLGAVLVEASATGLPIVSTHVGGIPEVVSHGVNGFLVQPADPDALAAAVLDLATNPNLRQQMGSAGRQLVTERFTMKREMDAWKRVYAECLSG